MRLPVSTPVYIDPLSSLDQFLTEQHRLERRPRREQQKEGR